MDKQQVLELIQFLEKTDLSKFMLKTESFEILIERGARSQEAAPLQPCVAAAPVQVASVKEDQALRGSPLFSPMIGVFYSSKKPGDPPFVKVGDRVQKGDILGLVEAMKTFYEVKAHVTGVVAALFVKDQARVDLASKIAEIEEV